MEDTQAVCRFGNTEYDSRIFDNLYRVFGSEDGGTILSAYWKEELKSFKIEVPYQIIKTLLEERSIGALCYNYDWKEFDVKKSLTKEDLNKMMRDMPMYTVPSNKWCIDLASKISYHSISELINNAERIKEYCKQMI